MRWVWVDRLLECVPGKSAVGVKCFSLSDVMFQDHFPGFPIVPGVIQIEMIAQVGGKALRAELTDSLPVLAQVKTAKFIRSIEPGDRCLIKANVDTLRSNYALVSGEIFVEDKRVASATVMYGMLPIEKADIANGDFVLNRWKREQKAKELALAAETSSAPPAGGLQ